jgi:hypothetical protein
MDQAAPFHSSARVWVIPPLPLDASPTAQQLEELVHATPKRLLFGEELGLGVGTMDQEKPLAPAEELDTIGIATHEVIMRTTPVSIRRSMRTSRLRRAPPSRVILRRPMTVNLRGIAHATVRISSVQPQSAMRG